MTNSIVTQDGDVINYANIARIALFTVSVGNEEETEPTDEAATFAYMIEAETAGKSDDEDGGSYTLGIYDDLTKAENAMEQIVKWLETGMKSIFRMPDNEE